MMHRRLVALMIAVLIGTAWPSLATAQNTPAQPAAPARARAASSPSRGWHVAGFATAGTITFAAQDSFDAVFGTHSGPVYGGGARVGLPWGGLFAEVSASRFRDTGERVFVFNGTRIPLGISTTVAVTPIEVSAGWQFKLRKAPKLTPYVAGGYTSLVAPNTRSRGGLASPARWRGGPCPMRWGTTACPRRFAKTTSAARRCVSRSRLVDDAVRAARPDHGVTDSTGTCRHLR